MIDVEEVRSIINKSIEIRHVLTQLIHVKVGEITNTCEVLKETCARFQYHSRQKYWTPFGRKFGLNWIFRTLDAKLYLGKFIVGRKGRTSRFCWLHSPASILAIVDNKTQPKEESLEENSLELTEWPIRLRHNLVLKLMLPNDLSSKEAELVIEYLRLAARNSSDSE